MEKLLYAVALAAMAIPARPAAADTIRPFEYFSVYSLGEIGSADKRFQANFFGPTGAAGGVYLSSSNVVTKSASPYALHAGGDLSVQYSTIGGHAESGGHIGMNGISVTGNLYAGGDIYDYEWGGGTICGSANASGNTLFSKRVNVQAAYSNVPYVPQVDHQAVSDYYLETSRYIGDLAATGSLDNQWCSRAAAGST